MNRPNLRKRRARQEGARAEKARRSPCAVCLALVCDLERFEFETDDHHNLAGHVVKTRGADPAEFVQVTGAGLAE